MDSKLDYQHDATTDEADEEGSPFAAAGWTPGMEAAMHNIWTHTYFDPPA